MMMKLEDFAIGHIYAFRYGGKDRLVRVKELGPAKNCRADAFIGFDANVNKGEGGYRQFVVSRIDGNVNEDIDLAL